MESEDTRNKLREINDKIDELQQEYFTCDIDDSLKSSQIEYELDCLYDLKNKLMGFNCVMEKLNLVEILKDCTEGVEFYSPIYGVVKFSHVDSGSDYPIRVILDTGYIQSFTKEGHLYDSHPDAECVLFPSKDNRDWSTFKTPVKKFNILELKPFDKVLVRDSDNWDWAIGLFSHYRNNAPVFKFRCVGECHIQCIPYNEKTKHLLGTTHMPPKKYINW